MPNRQEPSSAEPPRRRDPAPRHPESTTKSNSHLRLQDGARIGPRVPSLTDEDRQSMREYWRFYEAYREKIQEEVMTEIRRIPVFAKLIAGISPEQQKEEDRVSHIRQRAAIFDDAWSEYLQSAYRQGETYAQMGIAFADWYALIRMFRRPLLRFLPDFYQNDPTRMKLAAQGMATFFDIAMEALSEAYLGTKEKLIERQQQMILDAEKSEAETRRRLELATVQREWATELEATNKELEAFSYSVSHDLRAPLRGIDGFSQLLLERYESKLDEQGKTYLNKVRNASQRMSQLIDDILGLSRINRSEMTCEDVDLSAIARRIVEDLRQRDPDRRVEFLAPDHMPARADPRLIYIALENLLGNAWKFTSKHPSARIELGTSRRGDQIDYFIRDDGAGFSMEYAGKLFGAFQRLHETAEFPGSGIGLATVQRIVARHGGVIWAESGVESGAIFYFNLPGKGEVDG